MEYEYIHVYSTLIDHFMRNTCTPDYSCLVDKRSEENGQIGQTGKKVIITYMATLYNQKSISECTFGCPLRPQQLKTISGFTPVRYLRIKAHEDLVGDFFFLNPLVYKCSY